MTTNAERRSTTIYQFPARGRFAASGTNEGSEQAKAPRLPHVVSGSAWYHDEAIEAERASAK